MYKRRVRAEVRALRSGAAPESGPLSAGFRLQHPGARGQRLIAGPLLNAALKVFQRCRWCASCVPNDPYDLATAPTSAAGNRSRARGSPALTVSTAALADHVCDRWHRRLAPRRRFPGWRKRNPAGSPTTDAIWIFPAEVDRRYGQTNATYGPGPGSFIPTNAPGSSHLASGSPSCTVDANLSIDCSAYVLGGVGNTNRR